MSAKAPSHANPDARAHARPLAANLAALVAALPEALRPYGAEVARAVFESDPAGFPALSEEPLIARWLRALPCDAASDALHAHGYPYVTSCAPSADVADEPVRTRLAARALLGVQADRSCELREYDPAERARHARRVEVNAARYARALEAM